ncbi:hypothetical protein [Salinifilum aidingensis]
MPSTCPTTRSTCRRVLAGLVVSVALLGLPGLAQAAAPADPPAARTPAVSAPAVSAPAGHGRAPAAAVQAPPGPGRDSGATERRSRQDIAIGVGGVALIGLVLLSRRARKKPVLFVKWKK